MNGIRIGGTTLFLGYIPDRKQLCFYFEKTIGATCHVYPVAFVSRGREAQATARWQEMLDGIPGPAREKSDCDAESRQ